jgi:hypothetical protein
LLQSYLLTLTTILVHITQEDILKVIVDLPEEQARRAGDGRARLPPDEFDAGK